MTKGPLCAVTYSFKASKACLLKRMLSPKSVSAALSSSNTHQRYAIQMRNADSASSSGGALLTLVVHYKSRHTMLSNMHHNREFRLYIVQQLTIRMTWDSWDGVISHRQDKTLSIGWLIRKAEWCLTAMQGRQLELCGIFIIDGLSTSCHTNLKLQVAAGAVHFSSSKMLVTAKLLSA